MSKTTLGAVNHRIHRDYFLNPSHESYFVRQSWIYTESADGAVADAVTSAAEHANTQFIKQRYEFRQLLERTAKDMSQLMALAPERPIPLYQTLRSIIDNYKVQIVPRNVDELIVFYLDHAGGFFSVTRVDSIVREALVPGLVTAIYTGFEGVTNQEKKALIMALDQCIKVLERDGAASKASVQNLSDFRASVAAELKM